MRALRWWSLLLVPGGFVAAHELGYQAAATLGSPADASGGGHGYLGLVVMVGVPFAFAALTRSFLAGLRDQLPPVRYRTLALAQLALYLAVELVEHAAVGMAPAETLSRPAVVLGLLAQPLVAAALTLIVRTTRDAGAVVAASVARRRVFPPARPAWRPAADLPVVVAEPSYSAPTRGPPVPAVIAALATA